MHSCDPCARCTHRRCSLCCCCTRACRRPACASSSARRSRYGTHCGCPLNQSSSNACPGDVAHDVALMTYSGALSQGTSYLAADFHVKCYTGVYVAAACRAAALRAFFVAPPSFSVLPLPCLLPRVRSWWQYATVAITCIFLYPLGIPALFIGLIYRSVWSPLSTLAATDAISCCCDWPFAARSSGALCAAITCAISSASSTRHDSHNPS